MVKGYEYQRGQFVTFTAEELKALDVESSKVIDLEKFLPRGDIDPVYFDSPYYLYPDGPIAVETLPVICPLEGSGFDPSVPGAKKDRDAAPHRQAELAKIGSLVTRRWREMDSNLRSRSPR